MEAIYILQLTKAPEQTETLQFEEFLPGLETLTPVRGKIRIQHRGNYLDVSAKAETIVTLTCHRCLQQYNYRLVVEPSEIIWLGAAADQLDDIPIEQEIAVEDLVETLPAQGYFHPSEWLYEQMCLEIPQRQLCDAQCAGIQIATKEKAEKPIDQRWSSLEALRKHLL